jgi:hypothetical protein
VRTFLGLSIVECARVLDVRSPGSVTDWQSGRRMMPRWLIEKLGMRIAARLSTEQDRTVGVWIETHGAVWKVSAGTACKKCGEWFELDRARARLCKGCRVKHERIYND